MTAVEEYLNSIRRNTRQSEKTTNKLNETIKDLLHYEALKRAVSDGVLDATNEDLKKLSKLSQQILLAQEATGDEILEIYRLLQKFYDMIPTTTAGTTQVTVESWVAALKQVLDEFGDSLPEKFQNRIKYDLVSAAQQGGANPQQIFQQLNVTQVNMHVTLQQFLAYIENRDTKIELKAQAERPKQLEDKRNKDNFWQTKMGSIIGSLHGMLDALTKVGAWLGIIYVAMGVWQQLSEQMRKHLTGIAGWINIFRGGTLIKDFIRGLSGGILGLFTKIKTLFTGSFTKIMNSKLGSFLKGVGTKISDLFKTLGKTKIGGAIGKAGAAIGAAGGAIGAGFSKLMNTKAVQGIAKFLGSVGKLLFGPLKGLLGMVSKLAAPLLKFAGPVGLVIQVVASIFDFMEGFNNTQGTMAEKILAGLKNVVHKFFKAIASIPALIIKGLFKAWDAAAAYFKKGLPAIGKDIMSGFTFFAKEIFGLLTTPMSTLLGEMIERLHDKHPNIAGLLSAAKALLDRLSPDDPMAGRSISEGSKVLGTMSSSPDMLSDLFGTSTTSVSKMPISTYDAIMPLGNDSQLLNRKPLASTKDIRMNRGVKLSTQTADFIQRAGLTGVITSGMEGKHKGNASSPRTHASGNKFDYGVSAAISPKALADELRKMMTTPGIKEIRTEALPYSIVESARAILEKEGIKTKGILFNDGYPEYATGPHLDVLIDPKYSGQAGTVNAGAPQIATTTTTAESVAAPQLTGDPITDDLKLQLAKVQAEQTKLFEKGIKAPDQLAAEQNKKSTEKLVASMTPPNGNSGVTFNKQNDISDANLYAFYMIQV